MKTTVIKNGKLFKGAGYLIGFTIIILTTILEFIISKDFVVSILSVPIGTIMGLIIEQKLQGKQNPVTKMMKLQLFYILLVGITAFISLLLITKS